MSTKDSYELYGDTKKKLAQRADEIIIAYADIYADQNII